jgi:tRNA(Ile)-lysidine synthase
MARQLSEKKSLQDRILGYIRANNLIKPGQKILAAVSGGADSVCLLEILFGLQQELEISLHAAHLNHQLREEEADGDALYVAELAEKLKIPFTIGKRDVAAYQLKNKLSLEEAAREVRYGFLYEVMRETGSACVAAGHTMDDQAETILMHILRGTGIRGLRGLQPEQNLKISGGNLTVIRPLLEVKRSETEDFCKRIGLFPRIDSSNESYSMLRNRVRHELLPLLTQYNPSVCDSLLRISSVAVDDLIYLDTVTEQNWHKIVKRSGNTLIIDKNQFLDLHNSLKRNLLRFAVENLAGTLKDIETRHIEEIMQVLNKPAGRSVNLPYGLVFYIDYDRFLIGTDIETISPYPELDGQYKIKIPTDGVYGEWHVKSELYHGDEIEKALLKSDEEKLTACFDYDKTGSEIIMRTRRSGDAFQPLGMDSLKKVGEFMVDARVPRPWRSRIPVFCSSGQIIWLAGLRIDERVKVTAETRTALCLRLSFPAAI